jgi:hypothetical protein
MFHPLYGTVNLIRDRKKTIVLIIEIDLPPTNILVNVVSFCRLACING